MFFYIFSPVYNDCLMCIHFLLDIGLLNVNLLYVFYILSIYYAGDNPTLYYHGRLLHHQSLQLSAGLPSPQGCSKSRKYFNQNQNQSVPRKSNSQQAGVVGQT